MATNRGLAALAAALLALGILAASPAVAATDEQQGADVLDAVESGELDCDQLDATDFEAVGEFVMGRMLGSPGAHEGMDRMMASMMGEGGLERMHEVMGTRFAGCGNPPLPGAFGGMMGAMGMMGGGMMGGSGGGGMMGGFAPGAGDGAFRGQGYGPAAMMGFDRDDDDDEDVAGWMGVGMLVLLALAAGAVILVVRSSRRPAGGASPLDLLAERLARGEIGAEEYAERRRLLEEGAR